MEEKELSRYDFETELMELMVSNSKLKKETTKKKVRKLLNKYNDIIAYSKRDNEYYRERCNRYEQIAKALISGQITYSRGEKAKGVILISEVIGVEVLDDSVLLSMKNGKEITMGKDFKYLYDVFNRSLWLS